MIRVSVGGDLEGGHLVDVHDGTTHSVQRPEGVTTDVEAFVSAVETHGGKLWEDMKAAWSGDVDAVRAELQAAKNHIADLEAELVTARSAANKATIAASTPAIPVGGTPATATKPPA